MPFNNNQDNKDKTAYQQNVSKPVPQAPVQAQSLKRGDILGQIFNVAKNDQAKAKEMYGLYRKATQSPTSPIYSQYAAPTNQAVKELANYGIDATKMTTSWFQQNTEWQDNLLYNGTTNTPSKPPKRGSTAEQWKSYWTYQIFKSAQDTDDAENEWSALKEELSYKAQRKDLNYSDDEIISGIDWKKYPTLARMMQTEGVNPVELNRGIGFSKDDMYGVLWGARNGYVGSNTDYCIGMKALGNGVEWKDNPEIRAKLNRNNVDTYSPYSISMTLNDAGLYFGVDHFDDNILDQIRSKLDFTDETAVKYYNEAVEANKTTKKAEEELNLLTERVNKWIHNGMSTDTIKKNLEKQFDLKDFATLKSLDTSMETGGKLVDTTRAINYRKRDFIAAVEDVCRQNDELRTAAEVAAGSDTDPIDVRAAREQDTMTRDAASSFEDDASPMETTVFSGYSGSQDNAKTALTGVRLNKDSKEGMDKVYAGQTKTVNKSYIEGTIGVYGNISSFEGYQKNLDSAKKTIEQYTAELGDKVYYDKKQSLSFNTEIDGKSYKVTLSPDLNRVESVEDLESESPVWNSYEEYAQLGITNPEAWDEGTRVWETVLDSQEAQDFKAKYLEEEEKINRANALEVTDDDKQKIDTIRDLELQVQDAEEYIREHQDQYDKDIAAYNTAKEKREIHLKALEAAGADTSSVRTADAVMRELTGFTSYEATVWDEYEPTNAYVVAIAEGQDRNEVLKVAEAEHQEIIEQIKDIEWMEQYITDNKINLSGDVKKNIERRKAKLQRDLKAYEYFAESQNKDFDSVAALSEAETKRQYDEWQRTHSHNDNPFAGPQTLYKDFGDYEFYLTEDEKKTWYYLKAKDAQNGTNTAKEYADYLKDDTYGVMTVRARASTEKAAEELTSSGWIGFLAANAMSVALSPYNAVTSGLYALKQLATGSEVNYNSAFYAGSHFKNKTREQSAIEIDKQAKEWAKGDDGKYNVLKQVLQGGYEIVTNRADSAMNMMAFGGLFTGIENEILQEFLSAAPMGLSAAMDTVGQAKEKGASDSQALLLGAITFAAETGTEAISIDNMKSALNLGKKVTGGTFKKFAINWLTKAGISEMVGESINDIVENVADEKIMGILSEHAAAVMEYRRNGYDKDTAEAMARRDEINGVLHTALISYLSPGLDAFQTVKGRYQFYRGVQQDLKANQNKEVSLREVRNGILAEERSIASPVNRPEGEIDYSQYVRDEQATGEVPEDNGKPEEYQQIVTEKEQQAQAEAAEAERIAQAEAAEAAQKKQTADNAIINFEILESAQGGDRAVQNAAIAATLDDGSSEAGSDVANAAATTLHDVFGEERNAASEVQDLYIGAPVADVSESTIKQGLVYAALGGEDSACRQTLQSDEYQKANPANKATMLAAAVQQDQANEGITDTMNRNVHEYRVARVEAKLISEGAAEVVKKAEVKVDLAEVETQRAKDMLDTQRKVEQAARDAFTQASVNIQNEPSNDAERQWLSRTLNELQNAGKVTQEYVQMLDKAEQKERAAREEAKNIKQRTLSNIRQQAEAVIAQEDQSRAQAAEQQRIVEEQAAQEAAQKEAAQKEASNAYSAKVENLIDEEFSDFTEEQKDHVREVAKDVEKEFQTYDGDVSVTELLNRKVVVDRISKKFGVKIELADTTEGGKEIYKNGYYNPTTNTITIDARTTVNDLMYKVLGHELTHITEKSGMYASLANALLKSKYGNVDYASVLKKMESGDLTGQLEADIVEKRKQYESQLGREFSYEYALQEIVADEMGELLNGNKELVDRLAKEEPSLIRKVIDSIKGFIKKARGIEGEWRTQAQQTVDMLEAALKEVQKPFDANRVTKDSSYDSMSNEQYKKALIDNGIIRNDEPSGDETDLFGTAEEQKDRDSRNFVFNENTGDIEFYGYSKNNNDLEALGFTKKTIYDPENNDEKGYYYSINRKDIDFNILKELNSHINESKKFSLPSDEDYLAAVRSGDTETAQLMVDAAAQAAGYDTEYAVWRGDFEPYNVLEPGVTGGNLGQGLYFTPQRSYAEKFATRNSPVRKFYLKKGNTFDYDAFTQEFNDYALSWVENELYDDSGNIANIDSDTWSLIWDDFISEHGYDSVKATDVGGISYGASEIAVQNSWQAKLADPITYDDDGNVIPLSQRFNTQNDDIRYSLPNDDLLKQKIRYYIQQGTKTEHFLEGERPEMSTAQGPVVRGFASDDGLLRNATEMDRFAKAATMAQRTYFPDTNKKQIQRAIKWIGSLKLTENSDGFAEALQAVTADDFDYRSADGQAQMVAVIGIANARNDVMAQVALADAFMRQGTDLGRALQARKLFAMMTPQGRINSLQKMIKRQEAELNRHGKNIKLTFSQWIYQAAAAAEAEGDFNKVYAAALNEIAQQVPADWRGRVRSLRMLSMLANPRTHIRNVVGNMMFVPAVSLKNKIGAIAEIATGQKERTKSLKLTSSKEVRAFSKEVAEANKDILTGEAKYSEATLISRSQKKFGRFLDWLTGVNSDWLEKEDWIFLKGHFRRAFGGWMTANGYTVEQVKNDPALMEKGKTYAILEAQKATYRDFNKLSSTLNQVSKKGGVAGFVVDAVLPFKKTPANILKRGLEYSPAGILKAVTSDMYHLKQYQDYQNGKLTALPEKALSPNQVIDHFCAGLSGSLITLVGFLLAGTGAVSCGLDDDEDKFEKAQGGQEYAVNFGKAANDVLGLVGIPKLFGEDVTFTMDWAAPMSMPFFVGAAIRNQLDDQGEFDLDEVVNAFGNITEPVFNLSMLDGINTVFRTSQYDDTNTLTQIGAKVGTNYITSYVPSLFGALARTIDDKQRKSFVEQGKGTGVMGSLRYMQEQIENKIPGLNQTNIAIRDIWGEEKTNDFAERFFENFILPGYISTYKNDPILDEMGRLFDATGDAAMIPKEDPDKSITVTKNGEKIKKVLTDKEWDHYKEVRGKTAFDELTELMNTADYRNATDAVQAQMIKDIWSHADKIGKNAVMPEYEVEQADVTTIARESKIAGYKNELIKALKADDFVAYDTMVEAIREAYDDESEADAAIKTKVGNSLRDLWKEAYRKGDNATMNEIESWLDYTGYDFNIYGKGGWQEKVDEKYGT